MSEKIKREIPAWRKQAIDHSLHPVGFDRLCGVEFTEINDDETVISCELRPELLNPGGNVHGGVIATLSDVAACTMAGKADRVKHPLVTQSCSIHYLRPASTGRLLARAHVVRKGARVCVVSVDCEDEEHNRIATAIYEITYLDPNVLQSKS